MGYKPITNYLHDKHGPNDGCIIIYIYVTFRSVV